MKLCIYGTGAIGGFLASRLARSGCDVTLVARGAHLEAIRSHGLRVIEASGEEHRLHTAASDDPTMLGVHDHVILALKSHSVPAAVDGIRSLLGPDTTIVTAQNGIPWWYFYKHGGEVEGTHLDSVDPDGRLWRSLGPERALGCVVYPSCEIVEPGVVRHLHGLRFMLGEPDGARSDRVRELAAALTAGGLKAPVRRRIRDDIWLKLWGNVAFNPVSALTLSTLDRICANADSRRIARGIMAEAQSVAEALDVRFPVDLDTRLQWVEDVGAHKTSMLQDLEAERPLEADAVVGAVAELGRRVGVDTPVLDVVLGLLRARIDEG